MSNNRYALDTRGRWLTAEETRWLARAEEHEWNDNRYSERTRIWLEFQTSIRFFLSSLADGRVYRGRGSWWWWVGRLRDLLARGEKYYLEPKLAEICHQVGLGPENRPYSIRLAQVVELLKRSERILSETPAELSLVSQHVAVRDAFDHALYPSPLGKELLALKHCVEEVGVPEFSLYLHGSMATLDYTAFSDVDDLVVIEKSCWDSLASLRATLHALIKTARLFQVIDPFQHHGHFLITEFDLGCYDESVMPLAVLRYGKILRGRQQFKVNVMDSRAGFRRQLWETVQGIRGLVITGGYDGLDLYRLKHLVGKVALLPALLLQTQGIVMDKPRAIAMCRKTLNPKAQEALEWATLVRANWQDLAPQSFMKFLRMIARLPVLRRHEVEHIASRMAARLPSSKRVVLDRKTGTNVFILTDQASQTLADQVTHDSR